MRRRQPVEGSETLERIAWHSHWTEERGAERERRKELLLDRGIAREDGCRRCNNTGRVDFARRPGWDRDCPDCQGGPDGETELPDPECTVCRGQGRNPDPSTGWGDEPCPDCWRNGAACTTCEGFPSTLPCRDCGRAAWNREGS